MSAASRELGIHRATVNRHIELLEEQFGAKLFLKATKGYTPTELGREMQRIAELTDENLQQLHQTARLGDSKLHGDLVISTVELLLPDLLPSIALFASEFPKVRTKLVTSDAVARLEYGEADIAFRTGPEPQELDSVVTPFKRVKFGLFASKAYIERHGRLNCLTDLEDHRFVVPANAAIRQSTMARWLGKSAPPAASSVECSEPHRIASVIAAGAGIGFVPERTASDFPNLVQFMEPKASWFVNSWRVTHVDVHRSDKIQEFLRILSDS